MDWIFHVISELANSVPRIGRRSWLKNRHSGVKFFEDIIPFRSYKYGDYYGPKASLFSKSGASEGVESIENKEVQSKNAAEKQQKVKKNMTALNYWKTPEAFHPWIF